MIGKLLRNFKKELFPGKHQQKCVIKMYVQNKNLIKRIYFKVGSNGLDLQFGEHNLNYSQWLFQRKNSHHSDNYKELTGSKKITHRPFALSALGGKERKRPRCLFNAVNQAKLQCDKTALM